MFPLPFKHVVLPNFLADTGFIHHLVKELEGLEMLDKNIDLFKFQQVMFFIEPFYVRMT